jgi:hypothetical protein
MSDAQESTSYDEKRRAPRYQTRAQAIAALGVETQLPCTILDINQYGARIDFPTAAPPDGFYLVDIEAAIAFRARVVWRRAPLVGVRFIDTWELAVPSTPAWLREIRSAALREKAKARGIELVWSA